MQETIKDIKIETFQLTRYRCDSCQTSFVTKQALQKHNRRHTEDPELRPYACDYPGCNSTFKQKDHVRNHIRRTHEKSEEVFVCQVAEVESLSIALLLFFLIYSTALRVMREKTRWENI